MLRTFTHTQARANTFQNPHEHKCEEVGWEVATVGFAHLKQITHTHTHTRVTHVEDTLHAFSLTNSHDAHFTYVSPLIKPTALLHVAHDFLFFSTVSVVLKERRSKDSVTLAWQGPERPNGEIVEYEVIYYEKVRESATHRNGGTPLT